MNDFVEEMAKFSPAITPSFPGCRAAARTWLPIWGSHFPAFMSGCLLLPVEWDQRYSHLWAQVLNKWKASSCFLPLPMEDPAQKIMALEEEQEGKRSWSQKHHLVDSDLSFNSMCLWRWEMTSWVVRQLRFGSFFVMATSIIHPVLSA